MFIHHHYLTCCNSEYKCLYFCRDPESNYYLLFLKLITNQGKVLFFSFSLSPSGLQLVLDNRKKIGGQLLESFLKKKNQLSLIPFSLMQIRKKQHFYFQINLNSEVETTQISKSVSDPHHFISDRLSSS